MVGSDDGLSWWALTGWCTGDDMTSIHFDFSPKGGPKSLTGKYLRGEDGKITLTWPDGGVWELLAETADSKLVKTLYPAPPPPSAPKACCNCECGTAGQCGPSCSTCDCTGCCAQPSPPPPPLPLCNCACGGSGQCGQACYTCECDGCA